MALVSTLVLGLFTAAAQDYPNRPIRIVVGFAPGGGVDTVARLVGQEMSKSLGQSIVIENRPGAAGTIGAAAAARSEPDGYTLIMLPGGHPLYGATHKSLPFDTVNGFEWISTIVTLQFLAVVGPQSKHRTMAELIAGANAAPGSITYASAGVGSTHHLTVEMIADRAGVKFLHVPYQGDAPAVAALLAEQVQFTLATPTQAIGNIEGGKLRALAVTGNTRMRKLPDVPTVEQATGFKNFDVRTWFGLAAPAGVPAAIIARLNAEVRKALDNPEVRAQLEQIGGEVAPSTPAEFRDRVARELAMWVGVVEAIKLPRQ
ncbi:MAG: tripartite tricarboxylate transporter substrate binding protein [Hyphomicrobiales bacterium]|nr:tripartite tricarboxylate transporter substrate binding protein [Hyphomicrobiales bacterium]